MDGWGEATITMGEARRFPKCFEIKDPAIIRHIVATMNPETVKQNRKKFEAWANGRIAAVITNAHHPAFI